MNPLFYVVANSKRKYAKSFYSAMYLDDLSTVPLAVWDIRKKIRFAYRAIRVRRSSDNTELDIGFTGDDLDSATMLSFCGASDGFVTRFYDQTGNGFDFYQTNASKQGKIVSAGTYLTRVDTDGVNDCYRCDSLTNTGTKCALYGKFAAPATTSLMIFETSVDTNVHPGALYFVSRSIIGSGLYYAAMCDTGNKMRSVGYNPSLDTISQVSILWDRDNTGLDEVKMYEGGTALAPTSHPTLTNEQGGTFTTYDAYLSGRAESSVFITMNIVGLAFYNQDTQAIRSAIEGIVA